MEVLCLMGLYPKEYEKMIVENTISGMQTAANKFQWGIVNGITEEVNLKIINSLYIGSYPKRYKSLKIPSFLFQHKPEANDINVGFTNLSGYKFISKYVGIKREVTKWINSLDERKGVIIAYAMTTPFVEILNYVKKKYPNIKCCLVVPDLPEYMNVSRYENRFYRILKDAQCKHFRSQLKLIDGFIFLTDAMKEWFDWDVKYIVIEGISLLTKQCLNESNVHKKKKILYAGMIEAKYGVVDLVNSFNKISSSEWELHLYGNGSSLRDIEKVARNNNKIVIHGIVSNDIVLEAQKESEILINPRNDNNEFTKYSFPSKVIEYLGSGTPMIGYILPGMPKEYYDKFYVIPKKEYGMEECIRMVMNLSSQERKKMGQLAKEFIIKEKNVESQGKKILNFLKNL